MNAIGDRYSELDGEEGVLGPPITDELPTTDEIGRHRLFSGGSLIWHPDFGVYRVSKPILDRLHWLAIQSTGQVQIVLVSSRNKLFTIRGSSQSLYAEGNSIGQEELFTLIRASDEPGPLRHGDRVNLISVFNGNYAINAPDDRIRAIGESCDETAYFTVFRGNDDGDIIA